MDHLPAIAASSATPARLPVIDALRGAALFGVLLVNLRSFSLFGFLPRVEREQLSTAGFDAVALWVHATLIDGTAITLFSLLFGVGFAIQMQRADERTGATSRYVRRLSVLLLIGLLHAYLLWWGDILRYYALCGLVLLPMRRCPIALLAALGMVLVVIVPVLLEPVIPGLLPPQVGYRSAADAALAAFSSDSWQTALRGNLEHDLRLRIVLWVLPVYVTGRLMIGAALGRSGMLQAPEQHLHRWRRLLGVMLAIAIVVTTLLQLQMAGALEIALLVGDRYARIGMQLLRNAAPMALALVYLAAFVLLFRQPAWRRWLMLLAPVGRMALTHYLMQTVIAIALFYGIGFGLGPRYGMPAILGCAIAVFGFQLWVSHWWLANYRMGPVEWLWRSLSLWKCQTMRRPEGGNFPVSGRRG